MPARTAVALALCVTALAVGGCSSSGTAQPTAHTAPSGRSSKPSPIPSQHKPPTHVKQTAKHKSVAVTKCQATSTGWEAIGTANNAASKAQRYHITVYFTLKTATVLDFATTDVRVTAGKTGTWTAKASFDTGGNDLLCVVVGVS